MKLKYQYSYSRFTVRFALSSVELRWRHSNPSGQPQVTDVTKSRSQKTYPIHAHTDTHTHTHTDTHTHTQTILLTLYL